MRRLTLASHTGNERSTERDQKRLRTAIRILENWGLDQIDQVQILRVEPQLLSSQELAGALGIEHPRLTSRAFSEPQKLLRLHGSGELQPAI